MGDLQPPYLTIRTLSSGADRNSLTSTDSAYASANSDFTVPSTTHDIGRVNYHVKHLDSFARTLEDSASRAFPNRGRSHQRYTKVVSLLLHWKSDDLFVLPELEDLEKCFREEYGFETDTFPIPSENAHLELMMRIGALIKDHEATDTLFIVYYGGHARIDESRQSTWCATRNPNSPWLQWSAIQTLLERSVSDTLILLDCCAGAASATFPNGKSITETISASSWDAIAPDPGRYSFTNALIEVLQEWRVRTFSAAMLHAEVLARLKHPRPITINGKLFEARSTPVHFMMTANHRAPSIEISRILPRNRQLPSPPAEQDYGPYLPGPSGGRGPLSEPVSDPNEDEPHVMISLALEDDQNLDLNAWEQWLSSFPALAKYVKVQGVFKSHSTLLLLSVPVMVWDLLPENRACSFVAFIRSNNLIAEKRSTTPESVSTTIPVPVPTDSAAAKAPESGSTSNVDVSKVSATETVTADVDAEDESDVESIDGYTNSVISGTTFTPTAPSVRMSIATTAVSIGDSISQRQYPPLRPPPVTSASSSFISRPAPGGIQRTLSQGFGHGGPATPFDQTPSIRSVSPSQVRPSGMSSSRTAIVNQQRIARRTTFDRAGAADGPKLAQHIVDRLEEYFQQHPNPSVGIAEFFASNLGVEKRDIDLWFHRRRQQESMTQNLQNLKMVDHPSFDYGDGSGASMILPGQLNRLLDIFPPNNLLFVDLRSPTDFDKSHIYGAVNLRTPVSFIEQGFDLLDKVFTDDQSRRNFVRAPSSRCIIFYDRVLEFPWECPMADSLIGQLRTHKGWTGDYYVLKGHYREFSASFDKYITGDKMSQAAKDYVDSLRQRTPLSESDKERTEHSYAEWKALVEHESRNSLPDSTAHLDERRQAVDQHQAELEAELERRNPVLYRKALGLRQMPLKKSYSTTNMHSMTKGGFSDKYLEHNLRTELVGPLTRGLEKMHSHDQSYLGHSDSPHQVTPGYDKLGELTETSSRPSASDEFEEMDPRDDLLRDSPGFPKAGHHAGLGGSSNDVGTGRGGSNAADLPRSREKSFWKRLRVNK
ncbi:homeobox domain containing protein [Sporothrix schenckii 1099-18]|uniref:Homeobox domain containing protein n=1 Tax=Sporothrix schenckii 1099-18 TaxID=1397361 RepID=A0A0F2M841_SPOSC|nr:homeobox domain containing protein [Sporothrix schenckii 1099-18]KJR85863.1 homeobox domain containing protein [Sporothrix schenckii 1099-18]